jgi:serine/threonine protein kinase
MTKGRHPPLVCPDTITQVAQDLLRKLLDPNPESRITLDEVKKHPFLA